MDGDIVVYISPYGSYQIPPRMMPLEMQKVFPRPTQEEVEVGYEPPPYTDVAPLPANRAFWEWLEKKDIEAGKPQG